MAKRIGVAQVTLNYCLAGKRKPSLELIYHICDSFGVSADWLLGRTDDRAGAPSATPPETNPFQPELLKEIHELKQRVIALERQTFIAACG